MTVSYSYAMPPKECLGTDFAANAAFFLLENTGDVCGRWKGRMTAKDQRALFGRFIGKGLLIVNGAEETIYHSVTIAFGQDRDYSWTGTFRDLNDNMPHL